MIPGENLGAVISCEAKERIERFITQAEAAGAKVLVDGRGATVRGCENGFYVGPTVLELLGLTIPPEMGGRSLRMVAVTA